ncbi:MAG: hypothetical protein ACREAE_10255 [Nitrosopumilaceae archaeon]
MAPILDERVQEVSRRVDDSTSDLVDACLRSRDPLCNSEMPKLVELCKTQELTVCKDGSLASYFGQATLSLDNPVFTEEYKTRLDATTPNLIDACVDLKNDLDMILAEFGPGEEFSQALELYSEQLEDCNQTIHNIKNMCKELRNTINYVKVCDDPRLSRFP